MDPHLSRRVVICFWVLWIIQNVTLAQFILLNCNLAIVFQVWPAEQVEVIVVIPVVIHVYPVKWLALKLGKERIAAVLIALKSEYYLIVT